MKRYLMSIAIVLFICSTSYATTIFSDDFESGLSQWTGKASTGGLHNAIIVPDYLEPDNALAFSGTNAAGDIFTSVDAFSAGTYWLSFDYLGLSQDSGGYVGISAGLPGSHDWLWATGTVSGASPDLIDDGTWHSYTFQFEAGYDFHLMIEDYRGAGLGSPGDALFDNISLSTTEPVPEPATMMLFGIGLLGLAGIGRRKK